MGLHNTYMDGPLENYINTINAPESCGQLSLLGVSKSKRILIDPDGKGINDVPIEVIVKSREKSKIVNVNPFL